MTTLVCMYGGFREEIEVQEDFTTCLEKVFPIQPPSSALESRASAIYHLDGGQEVYIPPTTIIRVISE